MPCDDRPKRFARQAQARIDGVQFRAERGRDLGGAHLLQLREDEHLALFLVERFQKRGEHLRGFLLRGDLVGAWAELVAEVVQIGFGLRSNRMGVFFQQCQALPPDDVDDDGEDPAS
jgi:hypothetical protein